MESHLLEQPLNSSEAIQKPSSSLLEEKEFLLKNGEAITLPSLSIEKMNLFHGSSVIGIAALAEADRSTVGRGVYLTSDSVAAKGYALLRASMRAGHLEPIPVVYDTEIRGVSVINLTTRKAIIDFWKILREDLLRKRTETEAATDMASVITQGSIDNAMGAMNSASTMDSISLKNVFNNGIVESIATDLLMKMGYDGLVTLEAGEERNGVDVGNHDSYVIFRPESVVIKKETLIAK